MSLRRPAISAAFLAATVAAVLATCLALGACGSSSSSQGTATDSSSSTVGSTAATSTTAVSGPTTTARLATYRTAAGSGDRLLVVVGDSITDEGRAQVTDALAIGRRVIVDGHPGSTIAEQQGAADSLAAQSPSIAVIELGTNDVLRGSDLTSSAVNYGRIVGSWPMASCVVLVTIDPNLDRPGATARANEFNRTITTVAASDPSRYRLVDVEAVEREAAADPTFTGPFLYDGVHPTAAAHVRLAAAYQRAVDGCPG